MTMFVEIHIKECASSVIPSRLVHVANYMLKQARHRVHLLVVNTIIAAARERGVRLHEMYNHVLLAIVVGRVRVT